MTTRSIYSRIGDAIVKRLQSLALCSASDVLLRKFPWIVPGVVDSPSIIVSHVPERIAEATNESDDWTIGHAVACCAASNRDNTIANDSEGLLLWRERIIQDLLRDKRLADVPEVAAVSIEPGALWDPEAFRANWDASIFIVRSLVRRNRRGAPQT